MHDNTGKSSMCIGLTRPTAYFPINLNHTFKVFCQQDPGLFKKANLKWQSDSIGYEPRLVATSYDKIGCMACKEA